VSTSHGVFSFEREAGRTMVQPVDTGVPLTGWGTSSLGGLLSITK
jgi:hypothetical protein